MDLSNLSTYIELGAAAIVGGLAVFGLFNRTQQQNQASNNAVAQNLIDNYKLTVDEQDKKLKTSAEREIEQGKEIAHLQGQVKTLTEILQGKDPAMSSFLKNAPELARIADENNKLARETSQNVATLVTSMQALVQALTPKDPNQPLKL